MEHPFDMSDGKEKLKSILDSFPDDSAHWNEAQNRFRFIDRLLLECLGWEHHNIQVEERDESGGISDYNLSQPAKAVLEAKREAKNFDLLPGTKPNKVRRLRPFVEACGNLKEAVTQVVAYCGMRGAQVAVICNGPQLVIFQALAPGQSPLDSEAFIFNGFGDYVSHFDLLWKLLSPEGIDENRALRDLVQYKNPRIPSKASASIGEPDAFRYRNDFQENLRTLSSILLDNIEETPEIKSEFYRECYVSQEANNRNLILSKKIIAARYRRVADNGITPAKTGARIVGGRVHVDDELVSSSEGARPVVVIGDVGVGKTSYFENLFEGLSDEQKVKTYYIHINLGEQAALARDVRSFVLSAIPKILRTRYEVSLSDGDFVEKVYKGDLREFDKSVLGQLKSIDEEKYQLARIEFLNQKVSLLDEHLVASLEYLRKVRNKQIILVIDNADQRNFETQQDAFLIAQELAASRNLLVFIALRPSTFYKSKLSGSLSGYQNRLLTISPAPADEVIRKRISFALRVAEGKVAPIALEGVQLNLSNIVLFLTATLRSIRANKNIKLFLSNITGGNTRLVIELISGFCGSPNVESQRIVEIERETGQYVVPLHEFTKHALLGEYSYYNTLSSPVACNIYDISSADPKEHFLASLLIAFVSSPMGIKDNDGFVGAVDIIAEMVKLGFLIEQVQHSLRRLAEKRLIETPHGHYRELEVSDETLPDGFHFRATSIGVYHIRNWSCQFSFLDATCIDTPVFDTKTREYLASAADSHEISIRYERSVSFRNYLLSIWHQTNFEANYFDFAQSVAAQNESFDSVEKVVKTQSPRGSKGRPARRRWSRKS